MLKASIAKAPFLIDWKIPSIFLDFVWKCKKNLLDSPRFFSKLSSNFTKFLLESPRFSLILSFKMLWEPCCASFLDIYIWHLHFLILIFTLKLENSILNFLTNEIFVFGIVRLLCYCSNVPSKVFYGSIGADFLRISRATSKIKDLSCTCKQLLSLMLKQNGQVRRIKSSLIKLIHLHQEVFTKYNKWIEEVIQAIGF